MFIVRSCFLTFLPLLLSFSFSLSSSPSTPPLALVTIPAHSYFVKRIDPDLPVKWLVPPTTSAHSYEPPPREVLEASKATLWFYTGEAFEAKAMQAFKEVNPLMRCVDLRYELPLITASNHCCHAHHGKEGDFDPHFWLSPRLAKRQAETIYAALVELYPEKKEAYLKGLREFLSDLDQADKRLEEAFKSLKSRVVMVNHPSYGYLARDYNLIELSIEMAGKDPTPRELTRVIMEARKEGVKTIFVQPQYSQKGAELIAEEIGAKLVLLDPYDPDYLNLLDKIAKSFTEK